MSIYATGDTHGGIRHGIWDGFLHRLSTVSFPEQKEMTKDDFVVICGDFGGVWELVESKSEKYALDWLETKPFTTVFVPGNHENYDRLTGIREQDRLKSWLYQDLKKFTQEQIEAIRNGYPRKAWHGGFVREIRPSVLMLETGHVFDLDGCACYAFGGARSHDIAWGILDPLDFKSNSEFSRKYKELDRRGASFRVHGVSWWPQEMPDETDMERGLCVLEGCGNKVDFIFTHDSPAYVKLSLGLKPDELNVYLEKVKNTVSYRNWFFGHLHANHLFGGKDMLLYEQIVRIN